GGGTFEGFGLSVGAAGDVDADGLKDIVVGAPLHPNPAPYTGRAYVLHHLLPGNTDCDSFLTLGDYATSADCCTGPGLFPLAPDCRSADVDGDWDVDLRDFASFARAFCPP
ncbi:MAG: FG-GAP repeat protein, partial [Planctomycetes bacterium]|nr:FG-GAP repeat protein [Planctomycetota bacterium]